MTKITQIINSNEYPGNVYTGAVLEINQTTDYMDEEVFYLTVENERRYAAPCAGRISALISLDREELRRLRDSLNAVLGDDATDDLDYTVDPDWLAENAEALERNREAVQSYRDGSAWGESLLDTSSSDGKLTNASADADDMPAPFTKRTR